MGLGLKSVECVRLLSLQQVAFPVSHKINAAITCLPIKLAYKRNNLYFFDKVDVNVARIAVRLGWVPLKALPGSLQFHLIEE